MAVTPEVIPENTIPVLDHGFVRLDDAMADDLSVVNGARVSFARRKLEMDDSDAGLIRFLMRDRHGCYDDRTDVLTDQGWKAWPSVAGDELFATRSRAGVIEYQPALRLVRKEYRGHMIGFRGMSVDLLVTPDHRVLTASTTTRDGRRSPTFRLVPAHSVLWRSHRHLTSGQWLGPHVDWWPFQGAQIPARPLLALVGLFIGDGSLSRSGTYAVFNLRKEREIAFLRETVSSAGLELRVYGRQAQRFHVPLTDDLRELFGECYENREKVIPRRLLGLSTALLHTLFDGLMASDGSRHIRHVRADKLVYVTTSPKLAGQVQELALKLGRSASLRLCPRRLGDGHYGSKPCWQLAIYNARNSRPGLCRTRAQAKEHMGVEWYDGLIHCVEVPNRTLYVRRNGYPIWCGNTPFEHNAFRFHIRSPIFVAREWMRHRVGSFNEFSLRYARATEDFYVPEIEDVRTQVGKPGAYSFDPVSEELAETTREELRALYENAYATYERLVELGVAREIARSVLPVGAYTEFYWTVNARSLMNFISLRAAETAQREIRRYAEACERFFAERMPVTHEAFVASGRVPP